MWGVWLTARQLSLSSVAWYRHVRGAEDMPDGKSAQSGPCTPACPHRPSITRHDLSTELSLAPASADLGLEAPCGYS